MKTHSHKGDRVRSLLAGRIQSIMFALLLPACSGLGLAQGSYAACTGLERSYVVIGSDLEVRNSLNQGALSVTDGPTWRSAEFQPLTVGRYKTLQSLAFPTDDVDGAYYLGVAIDPQASVTNEQGESATFVFTCLEAMGDTNIEAGRGFGDAVLGLLESSGLSLLAGSDFAARFVDVEATFPPGACTTWQCLPGTVAEEDTEATGNETGDAADAPDDPEEESAAVEDDTDSPSQIQGELQAWTRGTDDAVVDLKVALELGSALEVGTIRLSGREMATGASEFLQFEVVIANFSDCPLQLDWRFLPRGEGRIWGGTEFPVVIEARGTKSQTALVDVTDLTSGALGAMWEGAAAEGCDISAEALASVTFPEPIFVQLQGVNTSSCAMTLEWTFVVSNPVSEVRATPIAMSMPDRKVTLVDSTVDLSAARGPVRGEWTGTTRACNDDLPGESFFGTVEIWDGASPDLSKKRVTITALDGRILAYVYFAPELPSEADERGEPAGQAAGRTARPPSTVSASSTTFDPLQERLNWARVPPYTP